MARALRKAFAVGWAWTDEHTLASGIMVAVPAVMVLLAFREAHDWLTAGLTVATGLCWVGVLMPTAVRETTVFISSGLTAICGAFVSIVFSRSLETMQTDPAFVPLFFSLVAAGSASMLGQHRNTVERRVAERELAAALLGIAEVQRELKEAYLRAAPKRLVRQLIGDIHNH